MILNAIDAALAFLTPRLGGWLLIVLAIAFVLCVYAAWMLVLDYAHAAAMAKERRQVQEEREREERRRQALERIMASTAKYRERVN